MILMYSTTSAPMQGKEADMFAEYSSKWKTINPLQKPAAASPQTKPQNPFAPSLCKPSTNIPAPTPAPSPFAMEVKSTAASDSLGKGSNTNDYHTLLTKFYEKHNVQKVPEVANNLEKYKVRRGVTEEADNFAFYFCIF